MIDAIARLLRTQPPEIAVIVDTDEKRTVVTTGVASSWPVFVSGSTLCGEVVLRLSADADPVLHHNGISVEFAGVALTGNTRSHELVSRRIVVAPPSDSPLRGASHRLAFDFGAVELPASSYVGRGAQLYYALRVNVRPPGSSRSERGHCYEQRLFGVLKNRFTEIAAPERPVLDVGLQDALHIRLELDSGMLCVGDVLCGTLSFLQVRVPIVEASISLSVSESLCSENTVSDLGDTILFERQLCDGPVRRGAVLPVVLDTACLSADTQPSASAIGGVFSVRYSVGVVLRDALRRRYYKQAEIVLLAPSAKYLPLTVSV